MSRDVSRDLLLGHPAGICRFVRIAPQARSVAIAGDDAMGVSIVADADDDGGADREVISAWGGYQEYVTHLVGRCHGSTLDPHKTSARHAKREWAK
jgi:hypothetical protein